MVHVERRDHPQGGKLRRWLDHIVKPGFAGRVLAMDSRVVVACAARHVPDPVSERDDWIAATALAHSLTVVTRNVVDFDATGVLILNPWEGQ